MTGGPWGPAAGPGNTGPGGHGSTGIGPGGRFMAADAAYDEARVVLLGAPWDATVTYRPGARFGPGRIREASYGLEEYSITLDRSLLDLAVHDAGDLDLPFGAPAAALEQIRRAVAAIARDGKVPVLLGGEHLITLAAVQALAEGPAGRDLVVIQMDAHADLRDTYQGQELSHATVMRRVSQVVGPGRLVQLGIRSGDREEVTFGRRHTRFCTQRVLEPLQEVLAELGDVPLYVSIDIDVLDPAWAPGTGTPEPGGIDLHELLAAVYALKGRHIIGADLVEVAPTLDPTERTVVTAAKIIRELLLSWF